jgi:glutamate-ammonia-ligase adenylyltransferase
MQESAPKWSLKRAAGGTVDVEFLVQLFLLKRIGEKPQVRTPSTIAGLRLLAEQGFLESEDAEQLQRSYQLLRSVETALRLSTEVPHMELSEQPEFLRKLTYLMRRPSPAELLGEIDAARLSNRRLLEKYLGRLQD